MIENKAIATRESYGNALVEIAKEHDDLVVLDADLAEATKTVIFKKAYPERHVDCGIAEANMAGIAAGMSTCGYVPFMSSFAMFAAGRAFEQVRNTIGYPHLNVKIGATHAGISVGEDGATHQCCEDIALMREIPGMVVINPCDDVEARAAVKAAYEYVGPVYLRFGRLAVPVLNDESTYKFEIGKGVVLREGKDVTIVATGLPVSNCLEAAEKLAADGIDAKVINIHTIKPLDEELIVAAAKETGKLLTVHQNRRWDDDFLIIKKLVEDGVVDGWDDPRLVSIAALRRRGFTPESIKKFVDLCGVSKANSSVDYAMLEYCIREDLKLKRPRMMAVLDPVKLIITNYPEGQVEYLEAPNNMENEKLGTRKIPFGRELYIEREDFMVDPPKKYKRMFPGTEVRLMNAYFVTCTGYEADEDGTVRVVHCTYDPATKGGNAPDGRKVKGTIHWVEASQAGKAEVRLYENIVDEEKGVYNKEDGSLNVNPNSLTKVTAYVEPALMEAKGYDSFQFVRTGFFCADIHDSKEGAPVFNRIVSLKSSFKLPKA